MEEKKYLNLDMLTLYDVLIKEFINSKIFIGTKAEYETANANGEIPINTLVIITDDETTSGGSGGGAISTIDTEMSDTSTNAVQNKVIKAYIDDQIKNAITRALQGDY